MHFVMRHPSVTDGASIWSIFREIPGLDLNSPYCYLLFAEQFGKTCLLAEADGTPAGAVVAYLRPDDPAALFIWQVGVATNFHGHGIGHAMLNHLITALAPARLEASIGPSNRASHALFRSVARSWGANFEVEPWLTPDHFPETGHEAEELIRIGPLPTGRNDNDTRMATS